MEIKKFLFKIIGKSRKEISYINKFQLLKIIMILKKILDLSLKRLKTDYIDIYMPHWPSIYFDEKRLSDFAYKMIRKGKIKNFGLSNFNIELVKKFKKHFKKKIFLQNEINLNNFSFHKKLLKYTFNHNIDIFAYGINYNFSKKNISDSEIKKIQNYQLSLYWIKNYKNVIPIIRTSKLKNLKDNIDIILSKRIINKKKFVYKSNFKEIAISRISKLNSQSGVVYQSIDEAKKNKKNLFPSPINIAEEIERIGILKPFYVKQLRNGQYEILSGQARYWACKIIYGNTKKIPVILIE